MMGPVFVVMPAYNAGRTLDLVFARLPPAALERIARYVVVDDGSMDDTAQVLARLARDNHRLVVLRHPVNRGYGAAEKTLLAYAVREGAEAAILLHADGQYSPELIPEMLQPLDTGAADLVQGSRMLGGGALRGGMPFYKFVANKWLTSMENRTFGLALAEYHSGYLAYSRRLLCAVPFARLRDTFEFDLEMMVCARILGMPIREIAIPTIYAGETSHLNPIRYGLDVLAVLRRYRRGYYRALMEAAP